LDADSLGNDHDFVRYEVSDPPAFVDRELLDVRHEYLRNLLTIEDLGELDAAVDSLHADAVLLVLEEVVEDGEQVAIGDTDWNQLDHVV